MKIASTVAVIAIGLALTTPASAPSETARHYASPPRIYLLAPGQRTLLPVTRTSPLVTPSGLLRALLAGPTAAEYRSGLRTAIPSTVGARVVRLSQRTAVVGLSGTMPSTKDTLTTIKRLSQIVFTLTQLPHVQRVSVLLNGHMWGVVDMHGKLIPVYSRSFFMRQGTICGDTGRCFSA